MMKAHASKDAHDYCYRYFSEMLISPIIIPSPAMTRRTAAMPSRYGAARGALDIRSFFQSQRVLAYSPPPAWPATAEGSKHSSLRQPRVVVPAVACSKTVGTAAQPHTWLVACARPSYRSAAVVGAAARVDDESPVGACITKAASPPRDNAFTSLFEVDIRRKRILLSAKAHAREISFRHGLEYQLSLECHLSRTCLML